MTKRANAFIVPRVFGVARTVRVRARSVNAAVSRRADSLHDLAEIRGARRELSGKPKAHWFWERQEATLKQAVLQ